MSAETASNEPLRPDLAAPLPKLPAAARAMWIVTWRSRLSWRRLPGALLVLAAMPALAFFAQEPGDTETFFALTLNVYLRLIVPLYCLITFGAMIRDELREGTLGFLLSRPLTRASLLGAKYLSHLLWTELFFLLSGALLLGAGWLRSMEGTGGLAAVLLPTQALAILTYGALGTLFGLITRRYLVLGVIYGFVVEVGVGRIPTNIHALSMAHHAEVLMAGNDAFAQATGLASEGIAFSAGILAAAAAVFLGLAILLFTFREYHANEEMQK